CAFILSLTFEVSTPNFKDTCKELNVDIIPECLTALGGIINENRVYNYCCSIQDLKNYFRFMANNPLDSSIYSQKTMVEMLRKNQKSICDKKITCGQFLRDVYDDPKIGF